MTGDPETSNHESTLVRMTGQDDPRQINLGLNGAGLNDGLLVPELEFLAFRIK